MQITFFAILISVVLFLTACPGPGGNDDTTPGGNGTSTPAAGPTQQPEKPTPESKLKALVDEIVAKVEKAGKDCDALAAALSSWTNRNEKDVERLIDEVKAKQDTTSLDAAQFDEQMVNGFLVVLEAATECGENQNAWLAWERFEELVKKATY